jgi:L-malate glycosyltransferase
VTRLDQFLPGFAPHDAIGSHVLQTRRVLREAGFDSDIFAEHIHGPMDRHAADFRSYPSTRQNTFLLYHASTSSPMASFLTDRDEPLLIDYHNITPARYFARWEPVAAASMTEARHQLRMLVDRVELAMAVSPFNRTELVESGYRRTAVVPLMIDFDVYSTAADARTLARLKRAKDRGGSQWLFVGRVAPNKCQHDIVGAFAAYRHLFDPHARLTLVGGMTSALYLRALTQLAEELGVADAVQLADSVDFPNLLAHYQTADVFVCMSEHEGFCIPALEAMHFDVPVVAYATAALPDTVGNAGILLDDKDPAIVACAVDRVLTDHQLRASLNEAGRARVEHFSLDNARKLFLDTVIPVVEAAGG